MNSGLIKCVRLDAPEFYKDPDFVKWLNESKKGIIATWHTGGAPNDFSDIFVTYDGGDGSNSDMPEHIWDEISLTCRKMDVNYCVVWITNVGSDIGKG